MARVDDARNEWWILDADYGVVLPYGIEAIRLPVAGPDAGPQALRGGVYCVSATNLQAVYLAAPGRWNVTYERDYQALLELLDRRGNETPNEPPLDR